MKGLLILSLWKNSMHVVHVITFFSSLKTNKGTGHTVRNFIGCVAKYERVFNGDAEYVVASCLGFLICLALSYLAVSK
jgi:phage-related protein